MIKGCIWSCDIENDGIEKLKYVRDRYYFSGINVTREVYRKNNSWIELENGDQWRVASACESSRGIRSNVAWIDSKCSKEFFNCVIRHTLISYNSPCYYEFY